MSVPGHESPNIADRITARRLTLLASIGFHVGMDEYGNLVLHVEIQGVTLIISDTPMHPCEYL